MVKKGKLKKEGLRQRRENVDIWGSWIKEVCPQCKMKKQESKGELKLTNADFRGGGGGGKPKGTKSARTEGKWTKKLSEGMGKRN